MYKQITTVAAALVALGYAADFVPDVSQYPEDMRAYKITEFNLQMVVKAINGDEKIDWKDTRQRKHFPWWWINEVSEGGVSGRGLSLDGVGYAGSGADVGPRLVFASKEKAAHAAEHFIALYEQYYLAD